MRLFIGIAVPRAHALSIAREAEVFSRIPGLRLVKPQYMHITLCFLGERGSGEIPEITEAMEGACRESEAFDASFVGIDAFPGKSRPRILVVPVSEGVEQLQRVEYFLSSRLNSSVQRKRYIPHITIGRAGRHDHLLVQRLKDIHGKQLPKGSFTVERLTLYKSVLHPTGAQYTICSERTLGI